MQKVKGKQRRKALRREKLKHIYHTQHNVYESPTLDRNKFISKVYGLFILSLITAGIGAYIGINIGHDYSYYWVFVLVGLLLIFFAFSVRRMVPYNLVALFTFTGFNGFTISALLNNIISTGGVEIIFSALALTVAIFVILSVYVHVTKKDFSWVGGLLFSALIILVIAGIAGLIFPNWINLVIYCSISLFVFCGFVLYDTSRIIIKYDTDEYIAATLDLYLDFMNIFIDILRVMHKLSSDAAKDIDIDIDIDL